jgi:hypothetical protein
MKPTIINYQQAIIVPREDGVDIIDPETNCWCTARTIRAAKWNLTVWRRLCREFKLAKHSLKLA